MKAKNIALLTKDLNRYGVHVSAIKYSDKIKSNLHTFELEMVSSSEKQMTRMIEKLTKANIKEYKVSLESITYDPQRALYTSKLKVELR